MKTASYSSSYSSFNQFQNQNQNGAAHNNQSLYYQSNHNTSHDADDYNKIQKKSSLK